MNLHRKDVALAITISHHKKGGSKATCMKKRVLVGNTRFSGFLHVYCNFISRSPDDDYVSRRYRYINNITSLFVCQYILYINKLFILFFSSYTKTQHYHKRAGSYHCCSAKPYCRITCLRRSAMSRNYFRQPLGFA